MKTTLILLFLLNAFIADASSKELVVGKWVFSHIKTDKPEDENMRAMYYRMMGELFFYFKANGHFKAMLFGEAKEGNWKLSDDESKILVEYNEGQTELLPLVEVNDTNLVLMIAEKLYVFKKTPPTSEDEVEAPRKMHNVTATPEQIAKKWKIIRVEDPKEDAEKDEKLEENKEKIWRESDSHFDFRPNGEFQMNMIGLEQKGTWKFNDTNTVLLVVIQDHTKTYQIYSISATDLVLQVGVEGKRFTLELYQ